MKVNKDNKFSWNSGNIKMTKKMNKVNIPRLKELLNLKEKNIHSGESCDKVHPEISHKKWEKSQEKA